MIIPSYMIHKSFMSSKENTEIIMKASLQNKRDGLLPTGAPVESSSLPYLGRSSLPVLERRPCNKGNAFCSKIKMQLKKERITCKLCYFTGSDADLP